MTLKQTSAAKYGINAKHICSNAITVIKTLHKAGYQAYLVGGGIRDLLVGLKPKDFDISTNAKPEEIISLFRRARIIGRRFRIVHVRFGRDVIEVTTFRGHHTNNHPHAVSSATGQLLRDNVYGSLEDDAIRRDLTINSLYYDLKSNKILDYTSALSDLKNRQIRVIGKPELRYREDPVRMLRTIRFAAKLGFEIERNSAEPLYTIANLLEHIPAARLFDEANKLFLSGYGEAVWSKMKEYNLLPCLFPLIKESMPNEQLLIQALINTDLRLSQNQGINPAFFYSVLLWQPLQKRIASFVDAGMNIMMASTAAAQEVIRTQIAVIAIPKRFTIVMRDIWDMQYRLSKRKGQWLDKNLSHPRFRAAYDFLLLREQCGEQTNGLGKWWTDYQDANTDKQQQMILALSPQGNKRNRRKISKPAR